MQPYNNYTIRTKTLDLSFQPFHKMKKRHFDNGAYFLASIILINRLHGHLSNISSLCTSFLHQDMLFKEDNGNGLPVIFFFCSPSQSPNVIWHFLYQHHCRCGAMPASYISNTYMIQPLLKHHHIIANIYNQYHITKAVWVDYRVPWVMKSQAPKKTFHNSR